MVGSDRIIITPRMNFAFGTDAKERMDNIEIEKHKRTIFILMDYKIGAEYALSQLIWTNDQA